MLHENVKSYLIYLNIKLDNNLSEFDQIGLKKLNHIQELIHVKNFVKCQAIQMIL